MRSRSIYTYTLGATLILTGATASCVGVLGDGVGSGAGDSGSGPGGDDPSSTAQALIAPRIRRLTNAEYDRAVADLLGTTLTLGAGFSPDARQSGYTRNADQRVDGPLAQEISDAADKLALDALQHLSTLLPCDPEADEKGCARTFTQKLAERAYRRKVASDEVDALMVVYDTGRDGGSFEEGVHYVISAILQSPSFLYLSEIGDPTPDGARALSPEESAASLSFFITGGPPDDTLRASVAAGKLATADDREREARRLIKTPAAREQVRRFIMEWLRIVDIDNTSKDAKTYPSYDELRPSMEEETKRFIDEVAWNRDARVGTFLNADFTFTDPALAAYYGVAAPAGSDPALVSIESTARRGILTQASFLSVLSRPTESSPVRRGVTILKRLFCEDMPVPMNPPKPIVPPDPDPSRTTRERYAAHSNDAFCATCHSKIDPIGFAFEAFDGAGAFRTTDNGKPVDTTGTLVGTDVDGSFTDARSLIAKLASSPAVVRCFEQHVARFGAATQGAGLETGFAAGVNSSADGVRDNVLELMVALAKSNLFTTRSAQ